MEVSEAVSYSLDEFDYDLPHDLIAQTPSDRRDAARLLILNRSDESISHRCFADILDYFRPGDVVVVNDTRVVPARLSGTKESGGQVELLVLNPYKDDIAGSREGYDCLIKASKRCRPDTLISLQNGIKAEVIAPLENGRAKVRFLSQEPLVKLLQGIGEVPLPPYIRRDGGPPPVNDQTCYQTVYARKPGAVAAPTAGLHFSAALLGQLLERGVQIVSVTLHVGYGTFAPIRARDIRQHRMHSEYAEISPEAAEALAGAAADGRRVVAVGTTVVRTLEWAALHSATGAAEPYKGFCEHYIYPGYRFRVVKAMITNFHLPQSTLILLVSAFAGRERILSAYQEAIRHRYRFFSYGDAMLIL